MVLTGARRRQTEREGLKERTKARIMRKTEERIEGVEGRSGEDGAFPWACSRCF